MKRRLLAAMVMGCVLAALTGCSDGGSEEKDHAIALSLVIGAHANSKAINFNNTLIQENVTDAVSSGGYVSVVCVDGDPDLLAANLYEIQDQYKGASKAKLASDAESREKALLSELQTVQADDPEVDILKSMQLAVRSLSDMDDMEKVILVIDSGLSTTGVMDFSRNLILAEPDALAEELYQKSAIPDFKGITVIWLQMGDTAAPQEELTDAQRENLSAIWKAVIEKTGGVYVSSLAPANEENEEVDYPEVSVIDLPKEEPISYDVEVLEKEENVFQDPVFLDEEQVQFIGDSAQYLDEEKAEEVLAPIADYMKNHPDFNLLLIGTTAGDEATEYSMNLSEERAEAVKNTLVQLGAEENHINTLGLGPNDPWHIYGAGTGMDDPVASSNRKVVLIDAESETAKELSER